MRIKFNLPAATFFLAVLLASSNFLFANITGKDEETVHRIVSEVLNEKMGNFIAVRRGVLHHGERIPLPIFQDGTTAKRSECTYFVSPKEITTSISQMSVFQGRSQSRRDLEQLSDADKRKALEKELLKPEPAADIKAELEKLVNFNKSESKDAILNLASEMVGLKEELRGQSFSEGAIYYVTCSVTDDGQVEIGLWKDRVVGPDANVADDQAFKNLEKYYKERGISSATPNSVDPQLEIYKGLKERLLVNYLVIAIRGEKAKSLRQELTAQITKPFRRIKSNV